MAQVENGVLVLKAKTDKKGVKTLSYQVAQIATQATKTNIKIIDCVVTFGGAKDILREVGNLDCLKEFQSILIYSPSQICKDKEEFKNLVDVLNNKYGVMVRFYRSGQW